MITTRVLPAAEWYRLEGTEAETIWEHLHPDSTRIVVVEKDEKIVGCHVLTWALHAECLWVDPTLRGKASVIRRLWPAVQENVKSMGADAFITAAIDQDVVDIIDHLNGVKIPGEHYVVPV